MFILQESQHERHQQQLTPKLLSLPTEILQEILTMAISADISSQQKLACVNQQINDLLNNIPHKCIHIRNEIEALLNLAAYDIVSLNRLSKLCGKESGLINELKKCVPHWYMAWIVLQKCMSPGIYSIQRVFWKK